MMRVGFGDALTIVTEGVGDAFISLIVRLAPLRGVEFFQPPFFGIVHHCYGLVECRQISEQVFGLLPTDRMFGLEDSHQDFFHAESFASGQTMSASDEPTFPPENTFGQDHNIYRRFETISFNRLY